MFFSKCIKSQKYRQFLCPLMPNKVKTDCEMSEILMFYCFRCSSRIFQAFFIDGNNLGTDAVGDRLPKFMKRTHTWQLKHSFWQLLHSFCRKLTDWLILNHFIDPVDKILRFCLLFVSASKQSITSPSPTKKSMWRMWNMHPLFRMDSTRRMSHQSK